jgi:hypothetical protein
LIFSRVQVMLLRPDGGERRLTSRRENLVLDLNDPIEEEIRL